MSSKRQMLMEKIENHLRITARRLVQFDTLEETLNYVIDSFWREFTCDLVAIILKEENYYVPKVWKGETTYFEQAFPMPIEACALNLLDRGWDTETLRESGPKDRPCAFRELMHKEKIVTWFAVPVKDEGISLGFCVIGFRNPLPLIPGAEQVFVEFGKDIAVAMKLAKTKEMGKRKMNWVKWFNKHYRPGSAIEQIVENIVNQASQSTQAGFACIYLYDEQDGCFTLQHPVYGSKNVREKIDVSRNVKLGDSFPFLEEAGHSQLSVPLEVCLKTIGILYVADKKTGVFTQDDLELLQFLATHGAVLLENSRLYSIEIKLRNRLQTILKYHQELVKHTVEGENVHTITQTLSSVFSKPVILLDRFLNPISHHLWDPREEDFSDILKQICQHKKLIDRLGKEGSWFAHPDKAGSQWGVWPVIGSGEGFGYLAIAMKEEECDEVHRFTIEYALNVYAIQFIKQRLILNTKEKVKDQFINELIEEHIKNEEEIIASAHLFNWNLCAPHRVAVFSIHLEREGEEDVLALEALISKLWELIRIRLATFDSTIMFARRKNLFILIIPELSVEKYGHGYWEMLYDQLQRVIRQEVSGAKLYLGIGGVTEKLRDYYLSFKQASQAHKITSTGFYERPYAQYDDIGVYSLLFQINDVKAAQLFIRKYLGPLLPQFQKGKADLFATLRAYLDHNGNLKETMEALFIHRNTLRYRMEKIRQLLDVDIQRAEDRLKLMLAYRLYDLYGQDLERGSIKWVPEYGTEWGLNG